jgi:hypothetical protein
MTITNELGGTGIKDRLGVCHHFLSIHNNAIEGRLPETLAKKEIILASTFK